MKRKVATPIGVTKYEEQLNSINLGITTAMSVELNNNWFGTNIVSPFSRLYYIKDGSGELVSDDRVIVLKPGNIYLIPVGHCFSYRSLGKLEKVYIHFNLIKQDGLDMLRGINDVITLERGMEYINEIYRLMGSKNDMDIFNLKLKIMTDISEITEKKKISVKDDTKYSDVVSKAIKIIRESPSKKLSGKIIADKLFVSETFIVRRFKREVGISVSDYIEKIVFYNVQTTLIETNDTINEISERYGFCDSFYLSRRFKMLFNESPLQYRKRLRIY